MTMDIAAATTITNVALLGFAGVCVWAIYRRPAKPIDPAGVAELREQMRRTTKYVALQQYALTHHRLDGGTGLCGCGAPIPCAERSRLDQAADRIIRERP